MRIYVKKGEVESNHAIFFAFPVLRRERKKNDKNCKVFFIVSRKALYLQTENESGGNKLLNIKYL